MKKQDVKIGMKVVPFRKTGGYVLGSVHWRSAKENDQKFLYVIGWREFAKCWALAESKGSVTGDWFNSGDFKPYEGK